MAKLSTPAKLGNEIKLGAPAKLGNEAKLDNPAKLCPQNSAPQIHAPIAVQYMPALKRSNSSPSLSRKNKKTSPLFLAQDESELRDPTKFGIAMSVINVFLYSLMALAQWMGWGGLYAATGTHGRVLPDAFAVMVINFLFGLLVIVGVFALKPTHFRPAVRYPLIALVALVAAAPRVLAMLSIYTTPSGSTFLLAELISGWVAGTVAVGAGVMTASLVGRARREHARWVLEHEKAQKASDELHTEEMRVRRMVADQLHGRLQFRLVTIAAGLDADALRMGNTGNAEVADLFSEYANQLDQIREQEVRALSHAVYPAGIELGAVSAIRAMANRMPPQIAATVSTCPTLTAVLERGMIVVPLAERLISVFTIEEAITNAIKHGNATSLNIELELNQGAEPGQVLLVGRVEDNGSGLGANSEELSKSGLSRHAARLTDRGGHLELTNRPAVPAGFTISGAAKDSNSGVRLEFSLPFTPLVPMAELTALANWSKGLKVCSA